MLGCRRRLKRILSGSKKRAFILALDQGLTEGPVQPEPTASVFLEMLADRPVQAVSLSKGLSRSSGHSIPESCAIIIQLSAGTRHGLPPYARSLVCSVAEALRLGAEAVTLQTYIGNDLEERHLTDLGMVIDEAHQFGLPVIAQIQARGGQIVNEYDPSLIGHCIRLGGEMGADMVVVPYSGEADSFRQAVSNSLIPVLVNGGPKQADFSKNLRLLEQALDCGAQGVCAGQMIFQQKDPIKALDRILGVVHNHGQLPLT